MWQLGLLVWLAPLWPQPPAWITHKDPQGLFSLQHPPGWKVTPGRKPGRVDIEGSQGEQVIIWPVFIPGSPEARSAPAVLRAMAVSLGMKVEWGEPHSAGAGVRMAGRSAERMAICFLTWVATPKGAAVNVYALAAPRAGYRPAQETFARILESFRAAGAVTRQASGSSLRWVRWPDPRENAFSLEVPAQWKTSGGLFRFAAVDVRTAWQTVSPDGQIRISGGDAELPAFTEPNQMLVMAGFHEGAWYSPGYGVRMLVRRYTPGAAFAREYVTNRVDCPGLGPRETRDRPDAVAAINGVYARYGTGISVYLTAGETAFTCGPPGRSMAGYYFAGTQRAQVPGMPGGLWNVEYLFGFVAPEAQASLAHGVLDHILGSVQLNPQWVAMQQNITANTSQIVSRTQAEISKSISSSYWSRQQSLDEISRRRSNAILGVVDVVDPLTGRELKVENDSNYYWMDPRGTIVGTQTDTRPNLDFRQLIQWP